MRRVSGSGTLSDGDSTSLELQTTQGPSSPLNATTSADFAPARVNVDPEVLDWSIPVKGGTAAQFDVGSLSTPHVTAPLGELVQVQLAVRTAFEKVRTLGRTDHDLADEFMIKLEALLHRFGDAAFELTGRIVLLEGVEPNVALTALRAASHVRDYGSTEMRRWLAEHALRSKIPALRYGALHVLADLRDAASVTQLKEAVARERLSAIRADIERLIGNIEAGK